MRSIVQGLRTQNVEIVRKHHKVQSDLQRQVEILKGSGDDGDGERRQGAAVPKRHGVQVARVNYSNTL